MLEVVEEDRKAQGLPDIATARAEAAEDPKVRTLLAAYDSGLRNIPSPPPLIRISFSPRQEACNKRMTRFPKALNEMVPAPPCSETFDAEWSSSETSVQGV